MSKQQNPTGGGTQRRWAAITALTAALVTACSMTPDYQRPETPAPGAYLADRSTPGATQAPVRWWEAFGSAELNALEQEALVNNRDLQAAVSRIAAVSAQGGVTASSLLPLIQAVGTTERRAPKGGGITAGSQGTTAGSGDSTYQVGLQASYEVDLWGKNREAVAAALEKVRASVFDREVVAMTLTADLASAYIQYLGFIDRIAVAKHNVDNMKAVLDTVGKRIAIGEGTEAERAQQRSILAQAEAVVPVLELQRDRAFNRIAILIGRTPENLTLTTRTLDGLKMPEVKPGLPSDLLRRRPDIQRAEAALISANADIGVARAKLLPTFGLTGQVGLGSTVLKTMMSPTGFLFTLAGNLAQTIFDGGKTANEIAFAEANYRELIQNYQKAVLSAFQDVDGALAATHWTAVQVAAQANATQYAREAHALSRSAYEIGTTDYLRVLESERTRTAEDEKSVLAQQARLQAAIDLFKALGGGFDLPEPPKGNKTAP